jgi:hypothetical protein
MTCDPTLKRELQEWAELMIPRELARPLAWGGSEGLLEWEQLDHFAPRL